MTREIKLYELLKHTDSLVDVQIYTEDSDDEPEYQGSIMNIPWYYVDYYLNTTLDYEAVSVYFDRDRAKTYLILNLKEKLSD